VARQTFSPHLTPRALGDGLVLRQATRRDRKAIAEFNGAIHGSEHDQPPEIDKWTRDLLSGDHPTCGLEWFTLVEDTATREIVSSLCLIGATWTYGGLPFGVGIPELVGTKKEYRRRGLIRAQFDVIHEWSNAAGHLVQAIGGIPHFYRQFGYEMALPMAPGHRGPTTEVPKLKKGAREPLCVRPATRNDLAFITRTYERGLERCLVAAAMEAGKWRYELDGRTRGGMHHKELRVIETAGGGRVGFLAHGREPAQGRERVNLGAYELAPGVSWLAVTPSVLRYLTDYGQKQAARVKKGFSSIDCYLAETHPIFRAAPGFFRHLWGPYAYYIRVGDLARFVRHVRPVLERRLAESIAAGHTGEVKLSFYRDGLRLVFARGKLRKVETWKPAAGQSAAFPFLTFLQLLFGRRSLQELQEAYPDCEVTHDCTAVLDLLFPKLPSEVWDAL